MSEGKSNDDDTDGKKMFNSSSSLIMNQFLAGGVSGLLSRAATHPVDTIKSQMQVSNLVVTRRSTERSGCDSTSHRRPILTSARLLNAKRAIQNLYRGFGAAALGAPMASGMYFLGYETTKKTLKKIRRERRREGAFNDDDHEEEEEDNKTTIYMIDNIITGVVAQAFAGIAYTPVDVVKERMQVSSVLPTNLKTNNGVDYRNAFDALKTIVKNEGIKNGLMRGYWAQNFVWWPWSACYFVAYEKGLEIFRRNNNDNKSSLRVDDDNGGVFGGDAERSNFESSSSSSSGVKSSSSFYREGGWYENNISPHAVSAFAAATCATILTHPLDLCKTRVQTMTNNNNNINNKKVMTLRTVFKDVVRKEGVLALYRGVFARVLSVAPGSAISFYAYESIRKSGALRLEEDD
jgi:solute carrier family 25 (mitochondrial citrate transporter), member 1